MKKYIWIVIIIIGAVFGISSCSREIGGEQTKITLYYVDADMNRLLPYYDTVTEGRAEAMAREALYKLIKGHAYNEKIRRLIPDNMSCSVTKVRDKTAYVNLRSELADSLPQSRDIEKLIIYQIVNTLTGIKGIRFVKFTVDGRTSRDFIGYYDMRETYRYRYPE